MKERMTITTELGVSLDKDYDCIAICWNCDKPVKSCPHISYALDRLNEYEDIGTVEECKVAVSLQSTNQEMKRKLQEYEALVEKYKNELEMLKAKKGNTTNGKEPQAV